MLKNLFNAALGKAQIPIGLENALIYLTVVDKNGMTKNASAAGHLILSGIEKIKMGTETQRTQMRWYKHLEEESMGVYNKTNNPEDLSKSCVLYIVMSFFLLADQLTLTGAQEHLEKIVHFIESNSNPDIQAKMQVTFPRK
jgi:hypothetical protein